MALEWDGKPGYVGYLEDEKGARERAMAGPPKCECETPFITASLEEDLHCHRCGKAIHAIGRPVGGRVAA